MTIRPQYDRSGSFQGFSAFVSGEWTTPTDYKAVAIAYRRAKKDRRADPLQDSGPIRIPERRAYERRT